jgi:hypothetical protein
MLKKYIIKQYIYYTVPPRIYINRHKFRKTSVSIIPSRAYIATLDLKKQKRQCYQPDREWIALNAQTRAHLHRQTDRQTDGQTHTYIFMCLCMHIYVCVCACVCVCVCARARARVL